MLLYVRRKFGAAHRLLAYPGQCSNLHGHTWTVEVWVAGSISEETGMVVDFKRVKNVIDALGDHKTILQVGDPLVEVLERRTEVRVLPYAPTAENLCRYLMESIPHATRVRVWESEDCYAEL